MIVETKLNNLDNKPIKVNKKTPPMSINKDLTPFYFTAIHCYTFADILCNATEPPLTLRGPRGLLALSHQMYLWLSGIWETAFLRRLLCN